MSTALIDSENSLGSQGRGRHLGEIARVFYHRGATWKQFGDFLLSYGNRRPAALDCRHSVTHPHAQALRAATIDSKFVAAWQHPCHTFGLFEAGKNPGCVVYEVVKAAGDFCQANGIVDPRSGVTGRDWTYVNEDDVDVSDPSSDGFIMDPEPSSALNELDSDNILPDPQELDEPEGEDGGERLGARRSLRSGGLGVTSFPSDGQLPSSDLGVSDPMIVDQSSEADSLYQFEGRTSTTKMRAEVIGYLMQFASDPRRLREEFRSLRSTNANILHLCGHGICKMAGTTRTGGCVEGTHMILGTQEVNIRHGHMHFMLDHATTPALYLALVEQCADEAVFGDSAGAF